MLKKDKTTYNINITVSPSDDGFTWTATTRNLVLRSSLPQATAHEAKRVAMTTLFERLLDNMR